MPATRLADYLDARHQLVNGSLADLHGEVPPVDFRSAISNRVTADWDAAFSGIPESAITKHADTASFDPDAWFDDDAYPIHERVQLVARGAVINDIQRLFAHHEQTVKHVLAVLDAVTELVSDTGPLEPAEAAERVREVSESPNWTVPAISPDCLTAGMLTGEEALPVFADCTTSSMSFSDAFTAVEVWLYTAHPGQFPETRSWPIAADHTDANSDSSVTAQDND